MKNSRLRNVTGQWVYVTTLCYSSLLLLLLFIGSSPSRQCEAKQKTKQRDRSPLYESTEGNYHHGDIDHRQIIAHHPSDLSHVQPAAYHDHKLALSATHDVEHTVPTTHKPKSYAFAYAVRDGQRGDDFAHKERRDGKVTVGEYSVVLPDGRTQVVRYTSDSLGGFKADVTYEGEEGHENYFQMHHPSPSPSPKPIASPQSQPQYQPVVSSVSSPQQQQISSPQYYDDVDLYRKYTPAANPTPSYRGSLPRGTSSSSTSSRSPSPSPSTKTKTPIYLSYPLKAQRPSLSPGLIYKTESGRYVDSQGNSLSASPTPVYYSQSPSPSPSTASYPIKVTSGSYRSGLKYYPSPSPNSLYSSSNSGNSNGIPVGITGASRPVKFSTVVSRNPGKTASSNYRSTPTKTYPSSAVVQNPLSSGQLPGPTSPYRQIPRGHRAGPDSSTYYTKSSGRFVNRGPSASTPYAAESSEHFGEEYTNYNHHPNGHPHDDIAFSHSDNNIQKANSRSGSKLIPIELFKAGPATTKATTTLQEQRRQALKNVSPSSRTPIFATTFSTPPEHRQDIYDLSSNHISAESTYSQGDQVYIAQQHQQQVNIPPIKSSVATYTSQLFGVTPKPNLFESTSSPGIGVGRPVRPSVGGLTYVNPKRKSGQVASRVPSSQTTTYDPYDPSFGNSVSYAPSSSNTNDANKHDEVVHDLPTNQLNHSPYHQNQHNPRDGIIREYLVEKKFRNVPGYEEELV